MLKRCPAERVSATRAIISAPNRDTLVSTSTIRMPAPAAARLRLRQSLTPKPFVCLQCQVRRQAFATRPSLRLQQEPRASDPAVPIRKQIKEEKRSKKSSKGLKTKENDKWELTVGIEVHAELNTTRKLFSAAHTSQNGAPNEHVSMFDAAVPGSQPHFQRETLLPALRAALAFGCEIQSESSFDRKHYFWWDQPNGYQITQYNGVSRLSSIQEDQQQLLTSSGKRPLRNRGRSHCIPTTT